jgi:ribonucleoside-diphosphate reductase beta chain
MIKTPYITTLSYILILIKFKTMESIIKDQSNSRYTVFPIKYNNLWTFYKQHLSTFWTAEEIKLTDDLVDWNSRLNDNERYFIKNILAFFAASDGIVNENLVVNFYNEVQIPEARQFYSVQMMIEAIHGETYSLLIDTYISNTEEKTKLFNAVETIPAVKRKAEWAIKWIQEGSVLQQMIPEQYLESYKHLQNPYADQPLADNHIEALEFLTRKRPSFAQRLLAFICVEGIFFSGSFCAIYWLKSRGLMPGLSTANQFISRDENLHAEFSISLYKMLENRLDQTTVHSIFKEAVEIEREFITESLPVSLIGMNEKLMSQYIEMVADRWLVLLGYDKIYGTPNPFPFMEMISLNEKVNFFENVVTNYQRSNVGTTEEERKIEFDCDDF